MDERANDVSEGSARQIIEILMKNNNNKLPSSELFSSRKNLDIYMRTFGLSVTRQ